MSDFKFEGHDWTELLVPLGLGEIATVREEHAAWEAGAAEAIRGEFDDALRESHNGNDTLADMIAVPLRAFLSALADAEEGIGESAVWRAMVGIEDSYTLLQFAKPLLTMMWS